MNAMTYNAALGLGTAAITAGVGMMAGFAVALVVAGSMVVMLTLATAVLVR